jgi:hypothetical protein
MRSSTGRRLPAVRSRIAIACAAVAAGLILPVGPRGAVVGVPAASAAAPARAFSVRGMALRLGQVDFGVPLHCPKDQYVGLALYRIGGRDPLWTLRDTTLEQEIRDSHCVGAGSSVSRVEGPVTVTPDREAHVVVSTLICGGSCAGYSVQAFGIRAAAAGVQVLDELPYLGLGPGGHQVRVAFPVLTLYRNDGYHDCPSRWTKMTYRWAKGIGYRPVSSIRYTSKICAAHDPSESWPPEPVR